MNTKHHDYTVLVCFEFARLARDVLGLRCVARLASAATSDHKATWYDIQVDVGHARTLDRDAPLQDTLVGAAYDMREKGAHAAAVRLSMFAGNDSVTDWCETVSNRMADTK